MKRANYHTHTTRCKHAIGTEREYIETAIEAGLEVLGFSDHVPQPYDGFTSSIRMGMEELPNYIETLLSLKEEYKPHIEINIGFEAEYIPSLFDKLMSIMQDYPVDYYILGQHFLDEEKPENYTGRKFQDRSRLQRYVDQVLEGLSTGKYAYLAHPDLIYFVGDQAIYREEMGRLCRECCKMNIPLELNRLGLYSERSYPSQEFFRIAAEEGNRVIIGYDAHEPAALMDEKTYQDCVAFARTLGITPDEAYRI